MGPTLGQHRSFGALFQSFSSRAKTHKLIGPSIELSINGKCVWTSWQNGLNYIFHEKNKANTSNELWNGAHASLIVGRISFRFLFFDTIFNVNGYINITAWRWITRTEAIMCVCFGICRRAEEKKISNQTHRHSYSKKKRSNSCSMRKLFKCIYDSVKSNMWTVYRAEKES